MAKYVFGIDLGTTYSCIAYVDETGRAVVVNNSEGTNTTPSVVNFASPTDVVVGQVAKDNAVIDPDNTVMLVKSLMGKSNYAITYNGEDLTPQEVSSYILRKLTGDAAKMLDTEVKDVVITCPAYFGDAERKATRAAGEIAGLNVLEIISEPTAAALYYGCSREQEEKTILVYDLGGGTFDVTVMKIAPGEIEVVCSDGNHDLGGKLWDEALMGYLDQQFREETHFDGDFDAYDAQALRLKAEQAKQQLTGRPEVPVMVDASGKRARITLTRDMFNSLTETLLNQTIELTDCCIAKAEEKGCHVDEILLVGGSTKMPQVKEALVAKYGMEPKILEPDEAVAKGAAIYALGSYELKVKQWEEKKKSGEVDPNDTKTQEEIKKYEQKPTASTEMIVGLGGKPIGEVVTVATTKSYALRVLVKSPDGKKVEKCNNMIIKNQPMPDGAISVTKVFGTDEANMLSVAIEVFESDFDTEYYDVDEDFKLGEAVLDLPGNLPENAPIEVTFSLSKEGVLEVTGRDLTNNKETRATMQASTGTTMSEEEIEKARKKSTAVVVQ
jgi:molecular chaperone DnaK (HSP70)